MDIRSAAEVTEDREKLEMDRTTSSTSANLMDEKQQEDEETCFTGMPML